MYGFGKYVSIENVRMNVCIITEPYKYWICSHWTKFAANRHNNICIFDAYEHWAWAKQGFTHVVGLWRRMTMNSSECLKYFSQFSSVCCRCCRVFMLIAFHSLIFLAIPCIHRHYLTLDSAIVRLSICLCVHVLVRAMAHTCASRIHTHSVYVCLCTTR